MTTAAAPLIWDNHTCLPLRLDERYLPQLRRARAAGVHVVAVNIGYGEQSPAEHLAMLAHFRRWLKAHPDDFVLVSGVDDVARARASGRLGVFFDIEGANAIGDQLSLVELYYDLGVRWMLVAYNRNNLAGGGCLDDDTGLTAFGTAMIAEMERVGMLLCCSHTGERTSLEAIAASRNPVIFSHSNARAVWDHPRNVSDRVIRACAERGGVVGVNGIGPFLGTGNLVEAFARHVDHIARVAGIDHVSIGLDYVYDVEELVAAVQSNPGLFGADAQRPSDYFTCLEPEALHAVVAELRRCGYGDEELAKILGGNLLRVATAVWR